jgi:predicted AAA+ superfamily ATPase
MALTDAQILRQNPWWTDNGWQARDQDLLALEARPARLPTPLVERIQLAQPGLHTIRGPRQVGKSTLLKLLVQQALQLGRTEKQVIYLTLDLLQGQPITEIDTTVSRAKELAGAGRGALVLLDEVTVVDGWDLAVKAMWDTGLIRGDVVVCTGSSALDLRRGAVERWPGRRGSGDDHLLLPQTFEGFVRSLHPAVPGSPSFSLQGLLSTEGLAVLRDMRPYGPDLSVAFERYLRFGGLPAAVAEAVNGATQPSRETTRIFANSLAREVGRQGTSEPAAYALLERIARSLGSRVSWSTIAQEMDVPLGVRRAPSVGSSPTSVRDHVEFMAASYFCMVLYAWKADLVGSDLAREKKLYFGDPLLSGVARETSGGPPEDLAAMAENVLALALYRRYEPADIQLHGFAMPTRLHFWRSHRGSEVDFLAGPRSALDCVEVKYRNAVDRRTLLGMSRAFPGRPVVIATKDEFEVRPEGALIPAHLLAWALG